jgi:FkbM family methyltransferase
MKINDRKITWKHPDIRFIDEVIIHKCYTPNEDFELKDDYIVVDAGANVGTFTLLAASKVTKGRIYSIEADKNEFKRLIDNMKANDFHNITPLNIALTDIVGQVIMSNGKVTSVGKGKIPRYTYEGSCNSITINELIKEYNIPKIDFLKIDIEGSEFVLFKDTDWLDKVKTIVIELHDSLDSDRVKMVIDKLNSRNFSVNTVQGINELYCFAKRK